MNDEIIEKIKAYYVANDIDKIIDYISNLQQENKKTKEAYERLTEDYVKKEYIVKAIENIFDEANGGDKNEENRITTE